ncbi:ABC transporter permease/M1 family aminopeptidase [Polyangium jinanense]|uniref:ABC transporter permease subunit n=1 Tax=Polyangium jinanense TaxID=2829994 RepID=A0A9X4AXF2_9BACT|nr:M1 family aminopeptidase [Polyangium jinanense]MDC3961866.1 ABC transporter permease subunit [Polyangium jinanense]MDC3987816.1 ABC transporter permease subunit [Polyangium jinanense]
MIRELFRFELREQLRSPLLWLIAGLFGLLAFGAAGSEAVQMGGSIGNVFRNAPTVLATWLAMFTLLGMLVITIFINSALLRDFDQGTAELFFSSPIRKRDYLLGRLGAALTASLIVYLVVGLGMFIAQFMPWIDPARLGPVSLRPYLWAFVVFVIPNLLFTGGLLSLMAVVTRSILWVYIGVIAFFVLYGVSSALLRNLDNVWAATLMDPLGTRALERTIRYWSAEERNTGLPAMGGYLAANRALWTTIAAALFAATFALFKTERSGTGRRRWGRNAKVEPLAAADLAARPVAVAAVQRPEPVFTTRTVWRQLLQKLRFDTTGVLRSVPFLVMLAFGMANFIPTALLRRTMYATPIYPVTSQMLSALQGSYSFLLVIIVLFYAGELVWKERGAKIHEVTDAMPVPSWVPLLAKFGALLSVIAAFQVIGAVTAMLIQLAKGYTELEPLLYLKTLTLDSSVYVLMGGMALALQVFSNNKFVGYALLILLLILQTALGLIDFTHHLYNFGSWPIAPYSDMNGYGHFLSPQLWFQGYWGLLLLALLLLSVAFWVRGSVGSRRERFVVARERLRGRLGAAFGLSLLSFAAVGGFLFWNTNIRNDYRSPEQKLDLSARYEKEYGAYKNLPQPKIKAASIQVDLRPETQVLRVDGVYRVENPHASPIQEVHVSLADDKALVAIDLGDAELVKHDAPLGYRIYRLKHPIQPGGEREVRFRLDSHANGITNEVQQTQIVENGSFFNNRMFPQFGYDEGAQLDDRNDRRKRGLGEPTRMPKLEDQAARANTYIGDDADWILFHTTICTAPDQIALAPGYLKEEFERDGRRCFSYAMDRPMLNFYAFLSARWKVKKGFYKEGTPEQIPIEIYYDPKHPYNVDRMIEAVRKSLSYYEANFTPYQHRQVRIIEFPGYASFAQSFANTIPYSESIGFIADLRDESAVDYVFYVTAHEIAHQWWAHQVIGANVQGATVLSESLSQYSALMVMEQEYGRAKMRRFLKEELDKYLAGRGGERVEELPLYRVENQQYIHYQKGSLVFYRLREEIGEATLNRALKKFLQDKGYQNPPFTTSAELLAYIRAEAGPAHEALITDLFEKICFYDNRVQAATARKRSDGKYEVTLELYADKRYADGKGKETAGELDDWIEVGVFARGESGKEADEGVLYLERHHVTTQQKEVTVVVDAEPYEAGFDPNNKLIDRVSSDNRKRVDL